MASRFCWGDHQSYAPRFENALIATVSDVVRVREHDLWRCFAAILRSDSSESVENGAGHLQRSRPAVSQARH